MCVTINSMGCNAKPLSDKCNTGIRNALETKGCGGCPGVHNGTHQCSSDHHSSKTKGAEANSLIVQLATAFKKFSLPPQFHDGTGHLSDTKAVAHSPDPTMRNAAPQSSTIRRRSGHDNASFVPSS